MDEALAKSAEALAFLEGGKPEPVRPEVETVERAESSKRSENESEGRRQKKTKRRVPPRPESKIKETQIRMTFRLPKTIADALIDVSAKRKKARDSRWSQQDIAAEALREWLRDHGSL